MPRQPRLILDNAYYHVIVRGNQKQAVFKDENDYNKYIKFLLKYKNRYKFKLYGWCLMGNHVHLIIESDRLSKMMHGINMSYAQYFVNKYETTGHLWQNRYKSYVIEKDEYLINCITYIEYNPIRANLVSQPADYVWSSYRIRIFGTGNNGLLDSITL